MMKLIALMGALAVFIMPGGAGAARAWEPADLPALQSDFYAAISRDYVTTPAGWVFSSDCDAADCYGTNPDSPYGLPVFQVGPNADRSSRSRQLSALDGLVVIMETPPPSRYFGATPYIYKRYYPGGPPSDPGGEPVVPVFESLTDTFNLYVVGTTGLLWAPFRELAAFVMTADEKTSADVTTALLNLGFPARAINHVPLPLEEVPLSMGASETADTFSFVTRTAYPDDPDELASYIDRAPVAVFHIRPRVARTLVSMAPLVSRQPGTGTAEPAHVGSARNALLQNLLTTYVRDYEITESSFVPKQTENYICADLGLECNGDNPDAIYTSDLEDFVPSSREDKILIVGVNHVNLAKATYFSHAVVDPSNKAGVVAIGDAWVQDYYGPTASVYALTLSYECGEDPTCLTIPEPTPTDPTGLPFGAPLNVTGRVYLEPLTGTRPDPAELIFHRVFVLRRRR